MVAPNHIKCSLCCSVALRTSSCIPQRQARRPVHAITIYSVDAYRCAPVLRRGLHDRSVRRCSINNGSQVMNVEIRVPA